MSSSLKSSKIGRVSTEHSDRLFAASRRLGESAMCPAGAHSIHHDIYGRPVSQNTLVMTDADCAKYTSRPSQRHIAIENAHRPYTPICASGLRSPSDLSSMNRDKLPKNLYGEGSRGNFVRTGVYPNDSLVIEEIPQIGAYYPKKMHGSTFSHDATTDQYRG